MKQTVCLRWDGLDVLGPIEQTRANPAGVAQALRIVLSRIVPRVAQRENDYAERRESGRKDEGGGARLGRTPARRDCGSVVSLPSLGTVMRTVVPWPA